MRTTTSISTDRIRTTNWEGNIWHHELDGSYQRWSWRTTIWTRTSPDVSSGMPPAAYDDVGTPLRQLLNAGIILPSRSHWALNVVLVLKKDKTLRLCVDYRQLNNIIKKDSYALPRKEELLDCHRHEVGIASSVNLWTTQEKECIHSRTSWFLWIHPYAIWDDQQSSNILTANRGLFGRLPPSNLLCVSSKMMSLYLGTRIKNISTTCD